LLLSSVDTVTYRRELAEEVAHSFFSALRYSRFESMKTEGYVALQEALVELNKHSVKPKPRRAQPQKPL